MCFFLIWCICPFKYQLSIFMKFTPKLWFILLNLQLETQFWSATSLSFIKYLLISSSHKLLSCNTLEKEGNLYEFAPRDYSQGLRTSMETIESNCSDFCIPFETRLVLSQLTANKKESEKLANINYNGTTGYRLTICRALSS